MTLLLTLTLSHCHTCWVADNINLPSTTNIWNTVSVNFTLRSHSLEENALSNLAQADRFSNGGSLFIEV